MWHGIRRFSIDFSIVAYLVVYISKYQINVIVSFSYRFYSSLIDSPFLYSSFKLV